MKLCDTWLDSVFFPRGVQYSPFSPPSRFRSRCRPKTKNRNLLTHSQRGLQECRCADIPLLRKGVYNIDQTVRILHAGAKCTPFDYASDANDASDENQPSRRK